MVNVVATKTKQFGVFGEINPSLIEGSYFFLLFPFFRLFLGFFSPLYFWLISSLLQAYCSLLSGGWFQNVWDFMN